jgi:hypothetical protein
VSTYQSICNGDTCRDPHPLHSSQLHSLLHLHRQVLLLWLWFKYELAGGTYSAYRNVRLIQCWSWPLLQVRCADFDVAFPGSFVRWPLSLALVTGSVMWLFTWPVAPYWWQASPSSTRLLVPVQINVRLRMGIAMGRDSTQIWTGLHLNQKPCRDWMQPLPVVQENWGNPKGAT